MVFVYLSCINGKLTVKSTSPAKKKTNKSKVAKTKKSVQTKSSSERLPTGLYVVSATPIV